MKIAVVYWSGTGNTEAMAQAVAEGAQNAGAQVDTYTSAEFCEGIVGDYDAFAFGCPAMGAEVLEEGEFDPMFTACEAALQGRKLVLFGSYGWGEGEWMRTWEERCLNGGMTLAAESVMANNTPDEAALEQCRALGAALTA